jgi:hypothetical protein
MNARSTNLSVVIGAVAFVSVLVGTAYLFKLPPFKEEVGQIEVSAVCDSLDPSPRTVDLLKSVLPQQPSYAFDEDVTLRAGDHDDSYSSACFISGDGHQLLSVRTQMMRAESTQSWVDSEVTQRTEESGALTPFGSGSKGVASPAVAAIFVPCASAGKIPGGQYNLSVVVHLERAGDASEEKARAGLIELAKSAATYAHIKAKCDMPSRVDEE